MTCYHPLKAFKLGLKPNGKLDLKIRSGKVDHLELRAGQLIDCYDSDFSFYSDKRYTEYIEIPCGKCIGCRLDYSAHWADRMMLEATCHDENYFVTLTYDDEHLHTSEYVDTDGVYHTNATLYKKDVQDFFKRLRDHLARLGRPPIRYFLAGEYGSHTMRPHYHAIIFGLSLDDLEIIGRTEYGIYYNSEFLRKVWTHGNILVATCNWLTCSYVARYVTKKLNGDLAKFYTDYNLLPEFSLMSLKPGIGLEYYQTHHDYIKDKSCLFVPDKDGFKRVAIPKYFKNKLELENPYEYDKMKENNIDIANTLKKLKLENTSLSYLDYLETEEINKISVINNLKRGDF